MSKFDELYEEVLNENKFKDIGIKDAQKRLMSKGKLEIVGQQKGGKKAGIVTSGHSSHSQTVFKINGKFVLADKSVGTEPWYYSVFNTEDDLKAETNRIATTAVKNRAEGRGAFQDILDAI